MLLVLLLCLELISLSRQFQQFVRAPFGQGVGDRIARLTAGKPSASVFVFRAFAEFTAIEEIGLQQHSHQHSLKPLGITDFGDRFL